MCTSLILSRLVRPLMARRHLCHFQFPHMLFLYCPGLCLIKNHRSYHCLYTWIFQVYKIGIRLSCIILTTYTFLHVFPVPCNLACISLSKSPLSCCQLSRYRKAVVCLSCWPPTIFSSLGTGCPLETSSTSAFFLLILIPCTASLLSTSLLLVVIPLSFWPPKRCHQHKSPSALHLHRVLLTDVVHQCYEQQWTAGWILI